MSRGRFDEDYDDRGRNRYQDDPSLTPEAILGWGTARAGLAMNFGGGIFVAIGSILLFFVSLSVNNRDPFGQNNPFRPNNFGRGGEIEIFGPLGRNAPPQNEFAALVATIAASLVLLGGVISLLGAFLSCGSTSASGAKVWSIGTRIMIFVFPLSFLLLPLFFEGRGAGRGAAQTFVVILILELIIMSLCWLMYLRAVASYVGSHATAVSAVIHLIVTELVLILPLVVLFSNPGMLAGVNPGTVDLISGGLTVVMAIWQVTIIAGARSGLTYFLIKSMLRRGY
jgi:hypothetical protein